MKMIHSAITSAIFTLARVVEVDLALGEESWSERIEIWQDSEDSTRFRCRFWETEPFRLIPSFPRDEQGEPAHQTEDTLLVERSLTGQGITLEPFHAATIEEAVTIALGDLRRFIEHATEEAVQ